MIYEFVIALGSIVAAFSVYFGFSNFFAQRDEVILDERRDLDGKELLLVNVVRYLIE